MNINPITTDPKKSVVKSLKERKQIEIEDLFPSNLFDHILENIKYLHEN